MVSLTNYQWLEREIEMASRLSDKWSRDLAKPIDALKKRLDVELSQLNVQLETSQAEVKQLTANLAELQGRFDSSQADVKRLSSQNDKLAAHALTIQSQLDDARSCDERLRDQLEQAERSVASLQFEQRAGLDTIGDLQDKLAKAQSKILELKEKLARAESTVAELTKKLETTERDAAKFQAGETKFKRAAIVLAVACLVSLVVLVVVSLSSPSTAPTPTPSVSNCVLAQPLSFIVKQGELESEFGSGTYFKLTEAAVLRPKVLTDSASCQELSFDWKVNNTPLNSLPANFSAFPLVYPPLIIPGQDIPLNVTVRVSNLRGNVSQDLFAYIVFTK